jgi:acyl transferase domain-containing protein/NADP-dependent 3-hydroxy acid dehydrogenase YdfG/acyl carrier protein
MSPIPPIAVVAVSSLLPGSQSPGQFWQSLVAGKDHVTEVPPTHWLVDDYYDPDPSAADKTYCRRGAFLSPVTFDPLQFGTPPKVLQATDTSQLLALLVAERLLASLSPDGLSSVDRERVSVVLGTSTLELLSSMAGRLQRPVWLKSLRECGVPEPEAQQICDRIADHHVPWQEDTFPGILSNVVAGRIANKFDLHGSNYTTDAACASSLAALSSGINQLALGQADLVITGGVDTLNDPLTYVNFSKTPALSRTGDCRPYSDAADGMVLGEAVVMFALKRLEDAERDGDAVHAVLRGVGFASDGHDTAIYAPSATGQARALRRAYEAAEYGPETVELVEGHGTGTMAGDAAELAGLKAVFAASRPADAQWCALGSVKSQVGHTKNAAGAAGLLKAVLALQHKVLPPTIKVDKPNPRLGIEESPFYLNTAARPWVSDGVNPRRAGVSSFGFGGADFHVTLEEYIGDHPRPALRAAPSELVLLSASSPDALLEQCRALRVDERPLDTLARDTQHSFDHTATTRLALVAGDAQDLRDKLDKAQSQIVTAPQHDFSLPGGVHYGAEPQTAGRVAFLCSGQGSQYPGMGAGLAMCYPDAMAVWDETARISLADPPLHRIVFPPPAFTPEGRSHQKHLIDRTEWAQPAMAVQSLAMLRVLRTLGLRPDAVAGHSFGELVALHIAGCYDAESLVRLARRRGELMRDAAPDGAMTALVATLDEATRLATGSSDLWVANHNAPDEVVVSGAVHAVEQLEEVFAREGGIARRLRTSTAFHSPLVTAARDGLREYLQQVDVRPPSVDVYANATADLYPADAEAVRQRIAEHTISPVRFAELVEVMYANGIHTFVEVGAGAVLTALTGKILGNRDHLVVSLDREGTEGATALHGGLAQLAVRGVALDYDRLWLPFEPADAAPSNESGRMSVEISGANYGRPYPPEEGVSALPAPNPSRSLAQGPLGLDAAAELPERPDAVPAAAPLRPAPAEQTAAEGFDTWSDRDELLHAMQETQQQVAQLHSTYQQLMADSHMAFLRMAEASIEAALAPDASGTAGLEAPAHHSTPVPHVPSAMSPVRGSVASYSADSATPAGSVMSVSAAGFDESGLLRIVAERTGYPLDVLDPEMELEADLGVDSIKRVEILSVVRTRFPELPQVDPALLARARTVREVAGTLAAAQDAQAVRPPAHTTPAEAAAVSPVRGSVASYSADSATPAGSVMSVSAAGFDESGLLRIVAERTGYPLEVLDPEMELEADLGVDSIKRVEILSVVRTRFPELPQVDPALLARARTVREVAGTLAAAQDAQAVRPPAYTTPGTPSVMERPEVVHPSRCAVRAVAVQACGTALPHLIGRRIAITDGGADVAERLASMLTDAGVQAFTSDAVPPDADGVIVLDGLLETDSRDVSHRVFGILRDAAARLRDSGGALVTVQDTGGDFGLSGSPRERAAFAGLAALARTMGKEWPGVTTKAIDCARGGRSDEEVARAIAQELITGGSSTDVGLAADGTRTELQDVDAPAGDRRVTVVGPKSVIVASGGARGVTAEALKALARSAAPRIALLGRTPLLDETEHLQGASGPNDVRDAVIQQLREAGTATPQRIRSETARLLAAREVRATIKSLEEAGSQVRYFAVDIRDLDQTVAALASVRKEWGAITGIVHGAGVLSDHKIEDMTDEGFRSVFATKVDGMRNLLRAASDDELDLLISFSSVAARYGNQGQADYAMANEVVSHLVCAERATRPRCLIRSIGWGPWDGGMVDTTLAARFTAAGISLIPLQDGAQAFVDELCTDSADMQVLISAGDRLRTAVRAQAGDVLVSSRSHPYLADHNIAGTPVLPLAMALEWFTSLVGVDQAIDGLDVLRKVGLGLFNEAGDLLRVTGPSEAGEVALFTGGMLPHYRARKGTRPAPGVWDVPASLPPFSSPVYDGHVLFHGPAFRALRSVEGLSDGGARGMLVGVRELGWPEPNGPWHTDPAAVDGALQLALLWGREALGCASLPMAVGSFRVYRPGPLADTAVALVRPRPPVAGPVAECDVRLCTRDGSPIAELERVRLVARPKG